jgi:ferrous-iron efflux pump FieF
VSLSTPQTDATASNGRLMKLAGASSVAVAATLVLLKTWAWQATDSVALLGSLADSLLDLVASMITFFAVRLALTPADREHRFGHGKSEGIASVVQALIITGSAGFVGFRAIERLIEPSAVATPGVGYAVMGISLLLTSGLIVLQRRVIRQTGSLAVRADAAHYQADVAMNVAVIGAIALNDQFGWLHADPILGLFVAALILISVKEIMRSALKDLLDHELPGEDRRRIRALAMEHADVLGVHDIRTRSSGVTQFIQLHIELDPALTLGRVHAISDEVDARICEAFPSAEVLIHADPYGLRERRDEF